MSNEKTSIDQTIKISQVITTLINIKEARGDLPILLLDDGSKSLVALCGIGEFEITHKEPEKEAADLKCCILVSFEGYRILNTQFKKKEAFEVRDIKDGDKNS